MPATAGRNFGNSFLGLVLLQLPLGIYSGQVHVYQWPHSVAMSYVAADDSP